MARSEDWETGCAERLEAARTRYLELLKAALLDEHYLDNEVRIEYLVTLPPGVAPDVAALRDPPRHLPVRFDRLAQARHVGQSADIRKNRSYFPYTDMGRAQLDRLHTALLDLRERGIDGDLAEFGVGRGGGGILMRAFLAAYEITDRRVWVFDRFLASDPQAGSDAETTSRLARFRADLNQVRDGYSRFGVLDERVRFLQAVPQDALAEAPVGRLALARLGAGLGRDLQPLLEGVHGLLAPGGIVIVEGTSNPGVERTVRETRDRLGLVSPLERIDWNAVTWIADAPIERASVVAAPRPRRVAIVPPAPTDAVDLSIVVVFYNMRREADRTLLSLSRSYQRDIEDLDYEVIAVENGSSPEQRLGSEYVESFGPEFRYLDLGADATPSPTTALNAGAAIARGRALAFMIDGAHVLTPGVLSLGVTAMETYAPAVVAVQQWYLGPGQQGDVMHGGYDQTAEDRLFDRIRWPTDGYRLFEIGHFIGDRDWFDGIVESNCVFVPRELLEQYGAFDDSFSMAGGGYANLDLFERIGAAPGVNVASILGQGTFHQVHGGTTTNVADAIARRELVSSYGIHYRELRGRGLAGLTKPVNYVGAMATKAARRTRSRREFTLSFDALRDPVSTSDAVSAVPVADELKLAAIEAVWEHRTWREATWLGHRVARFPTDLHSYQELISSTRPASVVVIGDDDGLGGRALFIASVCDALDDGQVVAIGSTNEDRPPHPRIVHIVGAAETAEVAEQVRQVVGDEPRALVIIGLGAVLRVVGVFELYAPLVPVDSYVVIENTIVNGRPVESGFGPGPHEAVVDILGRHREFVSDPTCERYTLTFNKGGFLRRVGWERVSEPQRFFFVHLQKTAGTALYRRLRESLGDAAVYPTAAEKQQRIDAVLDVAYMQRCFEARRDEIRVITGHFPLCASEVLGVPFSTFTVLRDPVERTLSFLRHHKKLELDAANVSFEEIYADPVRLHGLIHNHMVKMLSLTRDEMSHGAMTLVEFDDQRLEVAKQNLAERIDVFGLQEHFEPFCDLLSARYGWDLGSPRYANRTTPEEVSDEFRALIARDNRLDIELYEYAAQLWNERSERPGAG